MDAADTVEKAEPKKSKRAGEKETPIASAQRKWANDEKRRKTKNPVVESYYELVASRKLVLCHKTASGTVHRVLVGTTDDKDNGADVQAQAKRLQKEGRLKTRI